MLLHNHLRSSIRKANTIPKVIGTFYKGGYYIGDMYIDSGVYSYFVSPKSAEVNAIMFGSNTSNSYMINQVDGRLICKRAVASGAHHPAIIQALAYRGGDQTDWFLGALFEFDLVARAIKPNNISNNVYSPANPLLQPNNYSTTFPAITTLSAFNATTGGLEALSGNYWTSSEHLTYNTINNVLRIGTSNYGFTNSNKSALNKIRPIRKERILRFKPKFWRFEIIGRNNYATYGIYLSELYIRSSVGGPRITVPFANLTASSAGSEYTAVKLFDGYASTYYSCNISDATTPTTPLLITMEFTEGVDIMEYGFQVYSNNITRTPNAWRLKYSYDGIEWILADTRSDVTVWTANELKLYTTPASAFALEYNYGY